MFNFKKNSSITIPKASSDFPTPPMDTHNGLLPSAPPLPPYTYEYELE